ncbi:hypothetical protein CcaCcLH18_07193 [Colletotrichum camelliae]|nr:hypothetical protein CcaCcLH18_07193 [Colletotrichum camelliae]
MNGVQLSIQDLSQEAKTGHHERNEDSGSDSSWGLSDTGSVSDQQISAENEGNSNSPDEMQELLQSIRLAISILYKLPLRRPAPMDRLRFGTMNEAPWFEGPDVAHVKDKFPDSRLPENVQVRLGAITKRRQLLSYRRSHHEKLKNAHGWWDDASSQAMTKATTLCSDQMVPLKEVYELAPSVADSARTSTAASQSTREISIEVPPRPLDKDGQSATTFQCKYCQLTIHVMTDSSWRRHVIRDLQPYVCTFSECNLEDGHIFETENDWFEHEALMHRFKYFCNTPGHQKYTIAAAFQAHLKLDHSMDAEASKVALSVCKYPDNLSAGICDFCLVPSKNLKRHVSRHLRQLALFAISREDFARDDDDADENQGNLPRKAATSIHKDESTDASSKAYESTSKSASEREGKSLLSPENEADLENGDEDSFSPDLSPEHYMDEIEDHESFLSLGPDLAQPSIDESGEIGPHPRLSPSNVFPPAPSMMGQLSSKVSYSTQMKHKCEVCDKPFSRPSSLRTHMYSHSYEKPFACEIEGCVRRFSVVSNLRRHQKVMHKGENRSEAGSEDLNSDQIITKQGLLSKSEMGPLFESFETNPDILDMGLIPSKTGASNKGKNPEVPSNTTHGVEQNTGNQEQLLGRTKIHNIPDESITSKNSKQMGADEDKEDENYLRRVRFEPLTAGNTERSAESPQPHTSLSSSDKKRRTSGIFVNGKRVLDLSRQNRSGAEGIGVADSPPPPQLLKQVSAEADRSTKSPQPHTSSSSSDKKYRKSGIFVNGQRVFDSGRKNRSRAERIVVVGDPPTPRLPPKQFSTEADRSSQADSDLHKDCIPMKGENSKLREDLRVAIARTKELENNAKVLPDGKEKLMTERLRLKEENVKLEESMLPEDVENIRRRARANASVSAEELQKRT